MEQNSFGARATRPRQPAPRQLDDRVLTAELRIRQPDVAGDHIDEVRQRAARSRVAHLDPRIAAAGSHTYGGAIEVGTLSVDMRAVERARPGETS